MSVESHFKAIDELNCKLGLLIPRATVDQSLAAKNNRLETPKVFDNHL